MQSRTVGAVVRSMSIVLDMSVGSPDRAIKDGADFVSLIDARKWARAKLGGVAAAHACGFCLGEGSRDDAQWDLLLKGFSYLQIARPVGSGRSAESRSSPASSDLRGHTLGNNSVTPRGTPC